MDPVCELPFNINLYMLQINQFDLLQLVSIYTLHISCFALSLLIPEYYPNHTSYSLASQYRFDSTSVNIPTYFTLSHSPSNTMHWWHKCNKKEIDEGHRATEKLQKAHYIALTDCNDKKRLIEQQIETKLDLEADITDWVRAKCIQICACISVPCISYRMIHFYFAHTSIQIPLLPLQSLHITSHHKYTYTAFISFILSRYTQRFDLIYLALSFSFHPFCLTQ